MAANGRLLRTDLLLQDADAFALTAEAYINLVPWNHYKDDGSLRPEAAHAEALMLKVVCPF